MLIVLLISSLISSLLDLNNINKPPFLNSLTHTQGAFLAFSLSNNLYDGSFLPPLSLKSIILLSMSISVKVPLFLLLLRTVLPTSKV